ncbi:SPOR domain-containing protein [Acinetobacter sp. YH12070]|uniref:SPOR domain-containing protein n=1 Tax=Acinetobacter sp. YH12070 TaxID=2601066 RepID=UPI0015D455F6|nr:SPOR domain-containing protein [Acinetobacter sp. YH12070]
MNNKQRWMGGVVLLGGGVLLAALLLKGKEEIHQNQSQTPEMAQVEQQGQGAGKMSSLTVDVETEKRLLEEQRRTREKSVAEQEARAAEFLAMQQQAEADAARKAAEEYAALNAHRSAQQSSDNIPPELVEDEKAKQKRLAEDKLAAQKKLETQSAQQKADQARIAADKQKAEAKRKADAQKEAERKAHAEAEKKAADKKAAEAKQQAEEKRKAEAKKKAEAEKARDLLENGDKQWMVQVALAANEANADAVAAKLRAKGYKVTKSPTSKGIRIMVGPSKDRDAADATRKKINSDASLNMKSAWVIDWVPLDKR